MALNKYHEKRNFEETPEPKGGKPLKGSLRFVVQKHDASHLHYDFRLEMEGVLKSWAVPKGPSMDPEIKRLAMMVEDHPYDYRTFEGIIPSGYGAGTVIVWDEGTYLPMEPTGKTKKSHDEQLLAELKKGKVKIRLDGSRLKGDFALVKAYGRGENSWLLMKMDDEFATKKDILKNDTSIVSNKTLAEMEKDPGRTWNSKGSKKGAGKTKAVKETAEEKKPVSKTKSPKITATITKLISEGEEKRFSLRYKPMLATLTDEVFDNPDWQYEVKWDGYRALGLVNNGEAELKSRNDKTFSEKFFPVFDELKTWKVNAVIDGEIIVANAEGRSDFGALQNWRSPADGELLFYVFDILWLEGRDLTALPLTKRRRILELLVKGTDIIRLSESYTQSGTEFFEAARNLKLEGIMAKKSDSTYLVGARTREWLKIKTGNRQEMVIGGFTKNEDSPKLFSALLVGVFEDGKFIYKGKVGTGFNQAGQKELMQKFKRLIRKTPPFTSEPDVNKATRFRPDPPHAKATWLKPELVCEVNYTELTSEGVMRHPSFIALRIDKPAEKVEMEEKVKAPRKRKS